MCRAETRSEGTRLSSARTARASESSLGMGLENLEVSSDFFPWVADEVTFRVTVRNEDNGFTGRHFSISVDNVLAIPIARSVTIDVRPGSFPNSINLGSNGTIPVAILSTADFNAMTVDAASVTPADAQATVKGNGTPMATEEDVNIGCG